MSSLPKTALVTGAAKRIGECLALDLAAQGFAVVVHYHQSEVEAQAVVAAIRRNGGQAEAIQADVGIESQVLALADAAARAFGPIGLLVNNASIFERDEALTATRESWDAHMEINLRAPFVLTQAIAAALPKEADGLVVNLLDQRIWALTPHFTSYTVSKVGLWALTQTLALALAPRIRVNAIGPGPTLPSPRQDPAQFKRQFESMPLGHGTSPDEIAAALRFLIAAPSMTGQMIALDGGQHLGWSLPPRDTPPED
jgi:NAD(P)-dependent dehydrogenase (short-subunit alcohol dehydrogenase family)